MFEDNSVPFFSLISCFLMSSNNLRASSLLGSLWRTITTNKRLETLNEVYMHLTSNLRSLYKIRPRDRSCTWFRCISRYPHKRSVTFFTALRLTNALIMAESSINSNHWIYESNYFWAFTLTKVAIYQGKHSTDLAGFLTHRTDKSTENFPTFKEVWCLGFLGRWCSVSDFFWQGCDVYLIEEPVSPTCENWTLQIMVGIF